MMIAIVASIIPLAVRNGNELTKTLDVITVVIFIGDYILRLLTADLKLKKGKESFIENPFTLMAVIDLLSILPSVTLLNNSLKLLKLFRLCDTNHVLTSEYSEVIVVGAGADAVDYKLISICHRGDIVVSQDYGVAAMALGKGAFAIHQSGKWYTNDNIDQMLMERHLNKKARRSSHKNHIKGPKKRTEEEDERFAQSFEKMIKMAVESEM